MLVVAQEIAAGGAAFAGRDQVQAGAVGIHDEHLVAGVGRARGLEDQALAVGRPIGLGVLAAESELTDVGEVRGTARGRGRQASRALVAAFIEISAGDERAHFAVGDSAMEHPEATIGMDVVDAIGAEQSGARARCAAR